MTRDDDMIRIAGLNIRLKQLDLDWPPPEELIFMDITYKRLSFSKITDEQIKDMTHVCRGADYVPVDAIVTCASMGCDKKATRTYGGHPHCYDCLPPFMKH